MYLDNCEQLRLMQDISSVEDLPEIRDSIEFCENMVDTLQSELTGLKGKLSWVQILGHSYNIKKLDQCSGSCPEPVQNQ